MVARLARLPLGHERLGVSLDSLAGRRVLVTGTRGFIGSALVARLISIGAQVYGASRSPPLVGGDCSGVSWRQVDLSDGDATSRMIEAVRPDYVFHLAGATSGARDLDLVVPMLQTNLVATVNLLSALAYAEPERIVLAGSLEEPSPLDSDAVATSPYAVAKWATTAYARMLHDLWNLPVVTLRLAMIYGPGQRELYKLIPYVIGCLLDGTPPEVTTGTRKVDWLYIDDVVAALLAAALAPGAPGAVLDIGSGSAVAIADVTKLLTQMVSPDIDVHFGTRPDRPRDVDRQADISDAHEVLGWAPEIDLTTGLSRTVRWYRDLRESEA